jgi:hypothetical protein
VRNAIGRTVTDRSIIVSIEDGASGLDRLRLALNRAEDASLEATEAEGIEGIEG